MIGEGKYDMLASAFIQATEADGVLLIVVGGRLGHSCSCQMNDEGLKVMPNTLRRIADEMEKDFNIPKS